MALIRTMAAVTGISVIVHSLDPQRNDQREPKPLYSRAEAFVFGSVAALLLATSAAHAAGPTQAELSNAANDSANWPYVDHDYRGQRYTPLDQITAKNATDLAPVCSHSFPDKEPAQTVPVVYDGTPYATTAHYTVALDAARCKVVWQSEWKPRDHETFITQRGAAIKDGKVVRGTRDGYLLALDVRFWWSIFAATIGNPFAVARNLQATPTATCVLRNRGRDAHY